MKLFSQDDPAERAFQTCGKPCGPGEEGGGWHTSDRIYEANTTSLEQAPRGKLFFLGGHHCLPMLPSLQLYTYRLQHLTSSENIVWFSFSNDHFQTSFLFLVNIYIFSNQIIDISNVINFIRKIKIFPWVVLFLLFYKQFNIGNKKGVN